MAPTARFSYGGQALIEGVLMRGRDAVAVAMRHPDGSIVSASEGLDSPLHRSRYGRLPFVRGLIVLYDTLVGFRWLTRSANVAASGQGVERFHPRGEPGLTLRGRRTGLEGLARPGHGHRLVRHHLRPGRRRPAR